MEPIDKNHVYGQVKLSVFSDQPEVIYEPLKTTREERGRMIAEHIGNIRRTDDNHYEVKAQSTDGFYNIDKTEIGWICSCPDYRKRGDMNNNKMEWMNGEIRDREKVMRGLKKVDTPILQGMQIFHNYVRPHEALHGLTPADACGIEVIGDNKWLTLIQNASQKVPIVNSGF
jgi:hypothetical protein